MIQYTDMVEYPFKELEESNPDEPIVLDTETAGHGGTGNFVIYYSWASHDAVGSGAGPTTTQRGFDFLNAILASPRPKIFHAVTRDLAFLKATGLRYGGQVAGGDAIYGRSRPYCTLIAHSLLDEYHSTHALDDLGRDIFKEERPDYIELESYKRGVHKHKKNLGVPQDVMHRYAHKDALVTLRLWDWEVPRLKEQGLWDLYNTCMDAEMTWYQMEQDGVEFDRAAAMRALEEIEPTMTLMEREICNEFGEQFKITSSQQLGWVLKKHLPLVKQNKPTKDGKPTWCVDKEELRKYRYDYRVKMVLAYKMLAGASSKIRKRVEEGSTRLLPDYKQVLVTGRSSCSGVPLQQIAKRAGNVSVDDVGSEVLAKICGDAYRSTRRMWIPAAGSTLVTFDYDQGEYRAAAHYTGSERLIRLMQDPTVDFHAVICQLVFGQVNKWLRDIVKHVNFGLLYGMGVAGIARTISRLSGKDLSEFTSESPEEILRRYDREVPEMRGFQQEVIRTCLSRGYVIDVFGRRYRALPYWFKKVHDTDDYAIVNYLCQGTVGNIKRFALARLGKELFAPLRENGGKSKVIIDIHDELVFEIYPEDAHIIRDIYRIMTDFPQFKVPFSTAPNVGENLLDVKEMKIEEAVEACADGRFLRAAA